jgi:CHAD domain-containing protein
MLETVNALLERKGTRNRRVLLVALRARLQQQYASARAGFVSAKHAALSAGALQRSAQRIERWRRAPRQGGPELARGIRRVYRSARKALAAVEADCSPANLHELRKQVKYLREALAPFESSRIRAVNKTVKRAETLASVLGEDHDLFVLEQNVAAAEASLHRRSESFSEELARRRGKLQKRALERGRKVLRRKPGAFSRRLAV